MGHSGKIRLMRIIARMNVGGPAIQISGIEQNLNESIFEHLLVTGHCDETEIDYLIENEINLKVKKIPGLGKKVSFMGDLRALILIRNMIQQFNPDIVHTHTAKAGLLGRLAVLSTKKNVLLVHTFHGHLLHGYFSSIVTSVIVLIEKILASKTDILISVGKRVRDELLRVGIGIENQYRIVNPGLTIAPLPSRDLALSKYGLNPDYRYISCLGRLVRVKRPDRLLEIAAWLKINYPDVRIIIAGDGPLRKEIEQEAEKSALPIEFVGWVLDIESILALSELMILTSDNEGTPLSLIQAQMAGLPVVATDVGSVSEIVLNEETGFVVPTDTESINEAINELLIDREKARIMGQRAQVRALELYSVERLVRDHEKIYLNLIKSVQPPSRP